MGRAIADRGNVWIRGQHRLVHDDAVLARETGLLGQLDVGYDAYTNDDEIGAVLCAVRRLNAADRTVLVAFDRP